MDEQFSRISLMFGTEVVEKLHHARVAVFGIGGVGGFTAEALARSGIGTLDLIDNDKVCLSNINRQIIATHETIGRYKTEVMKERILSIYPEAKVNIHNCFFLPDNADQFDFRAYDYVIDAIDTITAKIQLVLSSKEAKTPIISCMGAGNKLDPTKFVVADIYETSVCPLAKVMRRELRRREVKQLKVVYSTEQPFCLFTSTPEKRVPGSIAFVPSVAGLILAGEVIKDIIFAK